jgi:hypothetical protein
MAIHVGNGQQQNTAYFKRLWHQLNTGGKARLLWELLNHDVRGFDPFKIPQTKELTKQKLLSLDPWTEWWHEKLENGLVLPTLSWDAGIPVQALYLDYVQHCRLTGIRSPKSVSYLTNRLRTLIPVEPVVKRSRLQHDMEFATGRLVSGTLQTIWMLPPLAQCRDFFNKKARSEINWQAADQEAPYLEPSDELPF